MCWSKNSKTLSWLGVLWGLLSLATLLTAFLSNVWLYTKEPIRFPNNDILTTVTFKIGLWRICPTFKRANTTPYVPNPSCTFVKYSSWDDITASDIGVSSALEFTPSFLSRMRISTPFGAASMVFILLATVFALAGLYNSDHKTLVACGLYMLGGLTLLGGLLIFASVLSDAYFERPRRSQIAGDSFDKFSTSTSFDYKYGWSFFVAGAAFFMSELAAVLSISAYIRRFSTVEEMVRVTVPGADRRLKERHGLAGEYLVQHQNKYQRHEADTSGSMTSGLSTKCCPKSEVLSSSQMDGMDSASLYIKPTPDICASDPGVSPEDVVPFPNLPAVKSEIVTSQGGSYSVKPEQPYTRDETTIIPLDPGQVSSTNSTFAGQTIPIVLMHSNHRPAKSSFPYGPPKDKPSIKSSALPLTEAVGCCLNGLEVRHSLTIPHPRRFCQGKKLEPSDREILAGNFVGRQPRAYDFGLTHLSPERDPNSGPYFETFHAEGTFIQPGILRQPIDLPGTSSTTSSSSGGTGSGMTITTGSSISSTSTANFPLLPEKKKKKAVTISNVFSTIDTFEPEGTEIDTFDSGSAV